MVKAFVWVFLAWVGATQVQAATINLNDGESMIIQPNVLTTVTCNVDPSNNCDNKISSLKALLNACEQNDTAGNCIFKYWPTFKKSSPQCYDSALSVCLDACQQNYTAGQCADKCSN